MQRSGADLLYFIRLGFKNVFRQRLRSFLALGAIALSVALVIVGISLTEGIQGKLFSEVLGDVGEIVVAKEDYFQKKRFNPLRHRLSESAKLRDHLMKVDGVVAALERIDFGLLAEYREKTFPIACTGLDLLQYAAFSALPDKIVAGRYPKAGEKAILVGKRIADELKIRPGDELTVLGQTIYDSFMADDYKVVGIFDFGIRMANRIAYLPLEQAQDFLEMPGAASKILVYGKNYLEATDLARKLRRLDLPPGVAVRPWTEEPLFASMFTMIRAVRLSIAGIICFVAGLGILNMMTVSVLERRKEIGLFMALGMSRLSITAAFFHEALLYGFLGSLLGILLGTPAALYLHRVGLTFDLDRIQGLPFAVTNSFHAQFGPGSLVIGFSVGVVLSLLGMVWPVLKTFSMGPQDAITRN